MTKTEYMNTINKKLTAAEALCADLRKLRGLQKLAQSITGSDALVSFEALGKTIADKEAELKTVRGELQKARRIVKKLDEIEAIVYSGTKLNIDYFLEDIMDEDHMLDIYDYFKESTTDDIDDAMDELGDDFTEEEIRLVRIKFISEMAN